ncbi:MAG: WG repeat-containing protein [Muribaculaceae bacterium]|nr:WG repeat-containing protein [Muribaculaceae bacterium]
MENKIFTNLKKFVNLASLKEHASHVYEFDNVMVIEKKDGKWGVMSNKGDEIVPFGKYDLIEPFFMGLARVKSGMSLWGRVITMANIAGELSIYPARKLYP